MLPTIFGMAASEPVSRTQKFMSQQNVNLLIANVGVLDPSEEIDDNEGVRPGEHIDSLSNIKNIGINVLVCQKEDIFAYQKTVKLRKATIIYDKLNNQFSVGFPWRVGEPPKDLTYTTVSEVNKVSQTSLKAFFYVQKRLSTAVC